MTLALTPEMASKLAISQRARKRRETRRVIDMGLHDEFVAAEAERWHDEAAHFVDAIAHAKAAHRGKDVIDGLIHEYDHARTQAAWWERRVGNLAPEPRPRRALDATMFDPKIEDPSELPEPTDIDFDNLSERAQRRLVAEVSDARNWAYEPTTEWTQTPTVTEYKDGNTVTKPGTMRLVRNKPGHHIIGTHGDLAFGRQSIVTYWSARRQQWILVRCWEGPPRNGFTQWIPNAMIPVPGPIMDDCERVERASLDDHSARCTVTLDTALAWSYEWAKRERQAIGELDPEDVLARGDWSFTPEGREWAAAQ
jgi:hypothetical protein